MILFIAGPARSGTSAFANYLNQHPEVLVCTERYKFIPSQITPSSFTFDRLMDNREGETNQPWEYYSKLLAQKDPAQLKWIGDKTPGYTKHLKTLQKNNPEARYIVLYRPVEEVAESHDARAKDLSDPWLTGKDGFKRGVKSWNKAMRRTRQFIKDSSRPNVLIVSYHDFFYHRNEDFIPLLSRFLGLEFDESVRETWRQTSRRHAATRRSKEPLTEEQLSYLAQNKAFAVEKWILDRIEKQWNDPEACFDEIEVRTPRVKPRLQGVRADDIAPESPSALQLEQRLQALEHQQSGRRKGQIERPASKRVESRASKLLRYLRKARDKVSKSAE